MIAEDMLRLQPPENDKDRKKKVARVNTPPMAVA